ncbi:restriction endonuclease subunit R [Taibaiella sp. KBW10]|uniref:type I restriction enzyme HsdR N-terminal domain-containing protein n=1 Tax=Taibaiella sp. KBW10 TaxID=2153357 RepID=UPI000F5B029D|nr:type I restriction enzyme HsdR N-terminal domain-containing protein [Taibaiella sp. KBW10]RQO32161.1 restriction endonuclease subunit R [Taibaiella sp. KBW10]
MITLPFNEPGFNIKSEAGKQHIFDVFRKKFVVLTPEEWVRQNVLAALVASAGYPQGLISVEKMLLVNQIRKRYDAVIFDHNRNPWMLIEFKAAVIDLSDQTLSQTLNYYKMLQCPYFMISNGQQTFCAENKNGSVQWLDALPVYNF